MISNKTNSRRLFIRDIFSAAAAITAGALVTEGCQSGKEPAKEQTGPSADPCSDSGLGKEDIKARKDLGYTLKSPFPNKQCRNCKLWLPAPAGQSCGKCQLFKGPTPATSYCTYWAPLV